MDFIMSNHNSMSDNETKEMNILPFPPTQLMNRVAGTDDKQWFDISGERTVKEWENMLALQGKTLHDFSTIVDYGCGCGRALRHLVKHIKPNQSIVGLDPDK